jgi:hypothetical protein
MKKQLQRFAVASLLIAGFAMQAKAQGQMKAESFLGEEVISDAQLATNLKMKANYSNWKLPVTAIEQLTSLTRYVNFMFQDSSVVFVYGDGQPGHNPWHSVGAVFTPNDENIELTDDFTKLSRYNEYTVDSLYFPYLYVRYIDEIEVEGAMVPVVDTLIIQFFKSDQLASGSFTPAGSETERFMKPDNFDANILGSNNVAYEMRIPLTAEDSTARPTAEGWSTGARIIPLPAGFDIASDAAQTDLQFTNAVGFSMSFKTMVPYNFGDTMETRDGSSITNKINYFGHSMFINESVEVKQTAYINNSWWVPSDVLYTGEQNGWENSIPGNAYFDDRYVNYGFHITTSTLGTDELDKNVTFGVYPNPVSKNQTLKADFNLVNATDVTIELFDLLGNKVKEVTNGYFASGEHKVDVNIADLTPGMYVYSIKAGNSVASKKVTIMD